MTTEEALDQAAETIARGRRFPWAWVAVFLCFILAGGTILLLVIRIGSLQDQITAARISRDEQFAALNAKVDDLQMRLTTAQAQSGAKDVQLVAKDARIRQLTDELIRRGIPVPAPIVIVPSPAPSPSPTSHPAPSPAVTPQPTPQPSPSTSRTPSPSPTPTGLLCQIVPPLLPLCVPRP